MPLVTESDLERADDFYQALIDTHRGLNEVDSHALNARLVLPLATTSATCRCCRSRVTARPQAVTA
jgi:hypothetical protein